LTDPNHRKLVLDHLHQWIEDLAEPESLPENFPREETASVEEPDLLTVVTALTGLTEEFRIQGRNFRKLHDELRILPDKLSHPQSPTSQPSISVSDIFALAGEEGQKELIKDVIEIHDRLWQTFEQSKKRFKKTGYLARITGAISVTRGMVDGLRLTLSRFDDMLAKYGVIRFGKSEEPFDPHSMKAVDAVQIPGKSPGTVVGIIRSGYRRHGKIIRLAEVQVSR